MKKIMQLSFAVICAAVMLASCSGDTLEADVAKTKAYLCKGMELGKKAQAGDEAAMSEIETLGKELETYMATLKEKYPEGSEQADAFEVEMKKIMADPEGSCK
jgi:hypothetical protein